MSSPNPPFGKIARATRTITLQFKGVDQYSAALQSNRAVHTVHQFENMSDPGDIRNVIANMFSRPPKPKPPEDPVVDGIAVLVTRIVKIDKRKAESAALVKKRARYLEILSNQASRMCQFSSCQFAVLGSVQCLVWCSTLLQIYRCLM